MKTYAETKQHKVWGTVTILWYDYNRKIKDLLGLWIGWPTKICQNMELLAISVSKISSWMLCSWSHLGVLKKLKCSWLSWKTIGMWLDCYGWATAAVVTPDQSNQLRVQCKISCHDIMTSPGNNKIQMNSRRLPDPICICVQCCTIFVSVVFIDECIPLISKKVLSCGKTCTKNYINHPYYSSSKIQVSQTSRPKRITPAIPYSIGIWVNSNVSPNWTKVIWGGYLFLAGMHKFTNSSRFRICLI